MRVRAGAAAVLPLLVACGGPHSAFRPASEAADAIAELGWMLTVVCVTVFVAVIALHAWALLRRGRADARDDDRRAVAAVVGAGAVTAVILAGLTVVTAVASGRIETLGEGEGGGEELLEVHVNGRQFWWEVRYPAYGIVTANEIHLPAGRPARIRLTSGDVIHSFWVPRLHGKRDMTPGRETDLVLAPREPGVYRGFCSEFCGVQHALMGLLVIAEEPERFDLWLRTQAEPAAPPSDPEALRGAEVFVREGCDVCHRVRGLDLEPPHEVGPDLTHLASRRTLAGATIPNDRGQLTAWIVQPHALKPGVRMPATVLSPSDLEALVSFLEGLQ